MPTFFVDFFFILSGFVMCHAYGKMFSQTVTGKDYRNFLRARLARVYPLHMATLGVYVGLSLIGVKQEVENPEWSVLSNVVLIQGTGVHKFPTWNVPAWSISVEWWTYTIFPMSFLLLQRHLGYGKWGTGLLVLCAAAFATIVLSVGHANITVGLALLRCCFGFFAGVSLYQLFHLRKRELPSNPLTVGLFAALAAVLIVLPSPGSDLVAFVLFCGLVYVTSKTSQTMQWLNWTPLVWLGDVSYSIYLWHTLMLHVFSKVALKVKANYPWSADQDPAVFIVLLLAFWVDLLTLAYVSHRFIEVPGRQFLMGSPVKKKEAPVIVVA